MSKRLSLGCKPGFLLGALVLLALLSQGCTPAHAADLGLGGKMAGNVAPEAAPAALFKARPSALVKSFALVQDLQVVRSRTVELDLSLLTAQTDLPTGTLVQQKSLSLNLFDDLGFIADADQIQTTAHGLTWIGTLRGVEQSQVVITLTGEVVAGNISMPDGRYHIRYLGNALHEVQKIDPSLFPEDEPPTPPSDFSDPQSALDAASSRISADIQADDGSTIDVMVVYSATARSAAGGSAAMLALINLAVAETNQSYQNSGIVQRLRLVHAEEVIYSETGKILDALRCITSTSDGCLDHVHALRNTYGADLVSFWVEQGDYCGIANMMRTVSASFESQAFSAVARSCATGYYSFGHELGHNMGASHDVYVETSNYPYSYAHGYTYAAIASPWRTVMAYNDACQAVGKYCTRLQYWSNPAIRYGADAMGNAKADNHLTLNNTAKVVANFRSSVVTPPCSIALSSSNSSVSANATTATLGVSAPAGCLWFAASNANWIAVTAGATGNGSANLSYSVQANTGSTSRVGTLNIAGQTFTVTQAGSVSTCTSTTLTVNRTFTGTLAPGDCIDRTSGNYYDLFTFSGTPGQKLDLSATSSRFDPNLLLIAPDGTTLYNDDGGGGTNPVIATTLNQTGIYQVVLASALPLQTGSYSFTFSLGVAAGSGTLPDLVVASVSAGAQATVGGLLYMSSTIKNQGLGAAPATDAGIYLSTDRVISTADIDTGFGCPIPALAAGESYSGCAGNITLPATLAVGLYYLGVLADLDGRIAESNEANNALAASATTQISASASSSGSSVVEFYHADLDHYFITADAREAAAINNGSAGAGWIRTGDSFKAGGSTSVCRFYGSVSPGPNSHFYTLAGAECDGLKQLQASTPATQKRWNFESLDFSSTPPVSGVCANGTTPVYRAYNNGEAQGIDSNHRITGSQLALQQVVARGWINEGVAMCAPP